MEAVWAHMGKARGVMTGPDITGVQLFGLQMGSGSGYANTEEADVAIEEDVGYAGEQKVSFPRNG
ncbi:BnaCnng36450D [Brassica napus]|uniref:BnaCnng36450D protein n=1 Tax=Brassica napus TaxID=3708 RepID=A0A078J9B1_BRANA|nr:BnaCnng36450D [Brassica napus]